MTNQVLTFRQDFQGHRAVVTAHYIPRMGVWGMCSRIDDVPFDHKTSQDPWLDARSMIEDAFYGVEQEVTDSPLDKVAVTTK